MKRIVLVSGVLCFCAIAIMSASAIRNWQAQRTAKLMDQPIPIPSPVQNAPAPSSLANSLPPSRVAAESPRQIKHLVFMAEVPELGAKNAAAIERLKQCMSEDTGEKFLPQETHTILTHQFAERRKAWYGQMLVGSFQKYARKGTAWTKPGEEFLKQTVAARIDGPKIPQKAQLELRPAATELVKAGCDDPVVSSELLQVLANTSSEYKNIKQQLFERFTKSSYPAHIAFWSGCPHLTAEQLISIQNARGIMDSENTRSPFDVSDPTDQRIVLEMLLARYNLQMQIWTSMAKTGNAVLQALGTNQPNSPWLKNMLLAYFTDSGMLDESLMMAMAGKKVEPRSREFVELMNSLKQDPAFETKLDQERKRYVDDFLLSAWHDLPQNPEPATLLLESLEMRHYVKIGEEVFVRDPKLIIGPEGSRAPFWFKQALQAQFDYAPAHRSFGSWLAKVDDDSAIQRLARECLECSRFDTTVPVKYLSYMNFITKKPTGEIAPFPISPEARQLEYSAGGMYQAIQALVAGYQKDPPPGVDLNSLKSHLACHAFFSQDFDRAMALVDEQGPRRDAAVFAGHRFSPREIQHQVSRKAAQAPFDLGSADSVASLGFAREGKSLMALCSHGRLHEFSIQDGTVISSSPEEKRFRRFAMPLGGERLVVEADSASLLGNLKGFEFEKAIAGVALIPIHGSAEASMHWATAEKRSDGEGLLLKFCDFQTGAVIASVPTGFTRIDGVTIAKRARLLAIYGVTGDANRQDHRPQLALWNLATRELTPLESPFDEAITALAITSDGTALALHGVDKEFFPESGPAYSTSLNMLDLSSGKTLWKSGCSRISCLQFFEDGKRLLSGQDDSMVHIWDRVSGEQVSYFVGHNSPVSAMAYLSKLGLLATGDSDGKIRLWDVSEGTDRRRVQGFIGSFQFASMRSLAVDPTTEDIVTGTGEGVIRWQKDAGYRAATLDPIEQFDWTADGRMLTVSATKNPGAPPSFSLQFGGSAVEGSTAKLTVESPVMPSLRIFPDGKSLITTGKVATVWNLKTGEPWRWGLLMGHKAAVVGIDISADGQRLVTLARPFNGGPAEVRTWEVPSDPDASGASCKVLFEHKGTLASIDLSADGKLLLTNSGLGDLEIWEVDSGRRLGTMSGSEARFSPDGKLFAVSAGPAEIVVYHSNSLQPAHKLKIPGNAPKHLCWGPQGKTLCFVDTGWVSCFEVETSRELIEMKFSAAGER